MKSNPGVLLPINCAKTKVYMSRYGNFAVCVILLVRTVVTALQWRTWSKLGGVRGGALDLRAGVWRARVDPGPVT